MKKVTLNTATKKKLELKKTAIANLQMSEEKMGLLIGGNIGVEETSKLVQDATNCTNRPTHRENTM
jgi:hypothetical protein